MDFNWLQFGPGGLVYSIHAIEERQLVREQGRALSSIGYEIGSRWIGLQWLNFNRIA